MRILIATLCTLAALLLVPCSLVGQYEPYPASGGEFYGRDFPGPSSSDRGGSAPYSEPPSYNRSYPPEYDQRNAPGDMRMGSGSYRAASYQAEPWRQPAPRDSSFRAERSASYAPDQASPYDRPSQDFRPSPQAPWGPPPDVYSIVPEGARTPAQSPDRLPPAEPAPPFGTGSGDNSASDSGQNEPAMEFFEPDPDDLEDGYIWYQPSTWEDFGWDTTIELGLKGSAGNSRTDSLKAGFKAERESEIYKFLFDVVHNRAGTEDESTQNNVLGKLRLDRKLGESRWSLFAQGTGEYDEFKDFDARLAGNMGVNYKFIKTETTTLAGDLGSGVSHEVGGVDDGYTPEAVFALDFKHTLSKRQKLYAKCEYFPDWSDWSSYRVVTDAGWELLLDEEWGLNLKIGVIDRYDSTPDSRKPNDLDYSMLLLWKL